MAHQTVNAVDAVKYIIKCIQAKLVVMLSGNPGIGKSSITQDIADKFDLHLIDLRLSQCDPVDLSGFPSIVRREKENDIATYIPMDMFPLEGATPPKGKGGWLLFLDEFNSAPLSVQAASYKLVLDRMVGQKKLHPNVAIVCAGNKESDGAIVNRQSTAMQSRLIHLELNVDHEAWTEWANKNQLDHRVIGYIGGRPDNLHNFKPDHNDKTFACPRTWEFVSKLIKNDPTPLMELAALIEGTIGQAVGREFIAFAETYTRLPTFQEIIRDPENAKMDEEPAMMFAVSHMIAAYVKKTNLDIAIKYINRMPIEFETITLQSVLQRDETMLQEKAIRDWIATRGAALF